MLLLALGETWIVTFWQPELGGISLWELVFPNIFAFPLVVYLSRDMWGGFTHYPFNLPPVQLGIAINCGFFNLFRLASPLVYRGSHDWVVWFTRIRLIAFQILFSFHLIAILVFLPIVICCDGLRHYSWK
jgi:hypothetical protein